MLKSAEEVVPKSGSRIFIRLPLNFSDYFFFAAFFLAFFFAAIIVSFKVNLGIVYVQFAVRTPNARFFRTTYIFAASFYAKNSR